MANYVLLETINLTQAVASVTFDNLPTSGYTDLKVVYSVRVDSSSQDVINISLNGSSSNFSSKLLYGLGSSAGSQSSPAQQSGIMNIASSTANTFSNGEIYIPNYLSSNYKSISADAAAENNATSAVMGLFATLWSNTSAVNSVTLTPTTPSGGNFVANSTFSLYGLAAVGTTPALAPKATGGNIVANDGTYWYHAYLSSGTFTPQVELSCDILTVAGGGGGASNIGGGGGAGGVVYLSGQSVSSASNVVVGAGGLFGGSNSSDFRGTNGVNSQFASLTAAVGGGAGGDQSFAGLSGGSGGGTRGTYQSAGSGTAGQGNAGGTGTNNWGTGGGGAGAVGGSDGTSTTGAGGDGVNTYSSWLSATSLGYSGYIAGGGGGGGFGSSAYGSNGGAGGGGRGGNVSGDPYGIAGKAYTGSGGGGGGYQAAGASGGSGLVIIRYAI